MVGGTQPVQNVVSVCDGRMQLVHLSQLDLGLAEL
jgi:hypothetical protein